MAEAEDGVLREVLASLRSIDLAVADIKRLPTWSDYASLKADAFRLDGRISQLPTSLTIVTALTATWGAGAAIAFTLLRFATP